MALRFAVVSVSDMFDRQVRAFGAAGQQRLGDTRVAIIGLGGTGSIAAQQLVHLGVRKFVLIDPDTIEVTNLNRVVGATAQDVGASKVSVAARYIKSFSSEADVSECEQAASRPTARKAPKILLYMITPCLTL